jgi:diacylglycerol kinase family enzyme
LALDLGIDRDDVVQALDAFGPAHERTIDLASVNGQTFVNNVSLGVYAEVVASSEYRDAKVATVTAMLPDLLGRATAFDLHLSGPDGPIDAPQIVQVSNNPYRFTSLAGFGSRPRIDSALLGVATVRLDGPLDADRLVALEAVGLVERHPGWKSWAIPQLEVDSAAAVPAGVDGESCLLTPPLRFAIDPGALRVRIAFGQSGASPAATHPPLSASTIVELWRLAIGRQSGGAL